MQNHFAKMRYENETEPVEKIFIEELLYAELELFLNLTFSVTNLSIT